jgi:hypothetical protein
MEGWKIGWMDEKEGYPQITQIAADYAKKRRVGRPAAEAHARQVKALSADGVRALRRRSAMRFRP